MKLATLLKRLDAGEVVALKTAAWTALAPEFRVRETRETGLAGELLVVTHGRRWAAVEQPDAATRTVRPLAGPGDAERFLAERLAAYDRLWDG